MEFQMLNWLYKWASTNKWESRQGVSGYAIYDYTTSAGC